MNYSYSRKLTSKLFFFSFQWCWQAAAPFQDQTVPEDTSVLHPCCHPGWSPAGIWERGGRLIWDVKKNTVRTERMAAASELLGALQLPDWHLRPRRQRNVTARWKAAAMSARIPGLRETPSSTGQQKCWAIKWTIVSRIICQAKRSAWGVTSRGTSGRTARNGRIRLSRVTLLGWKWYFINFISMACAGLVWTFCQALGFFIFFNYYD